VLRRFRLLKPLIELGQTKRTFAEVNVIGRQLGASAHVIADVLFEEAVSILATNHWDTVTCRCSGSLPV
jgi:hypothetical protein